LAYVLGLDDLTAIDAALAEPTEHTGHQEPNKPGKPSTEPYTTHVAMIVHDITTVKPRQMVEQSRKALLVSTAAMRKVFSNRHDLLQTPKSEAGSLAVMLNQTH
jgi:hypothetical protein